MLKIEIVDPESMDKNVLKSVIDLLLTFVPILDETDKESYSDGDWKEPELIPVANKDLYSLADTPARLEVLDTPQVFHVKQFPETVTIPPPPPINPFSVNPEFTTNPLPISKGGSPIELDTRGFPHHVRIHSRTKSKNKDGTWKYLRSVSPRLIESVENEIKGIVKPPTFVPAPPPVQPTLPEMDMIGLMEIVTDGISSGKLFRQDITQVISKFGFASLPLVSEQPEKIPAIAAALKDVIQNAR